MSIIINSTEYITTEEVEALPEFWEMLQKSYEELAAMLCPDGNLDARQTIDSLTYEEIKEASGYDLDLFWYKSRQFAALLIYGWGTCDMVKVRSGCMGTGEFVDVLVVKDEFLTPPPDGKRQRLHNIFPKGPILEIIKNSPSMFNRRSPTPYNE